ncbi:MAG: amidohydrolase family protein [candidate division WOR-3 bacterium]
MENIVILIVITQSFIVKNVNVYTPNGRIDSVDVLVEDGIIKKIAKNIEFPKNFEIIDGNFNNLYPGLINSISAIGLVEIAAVRATNDLSEIGEFNALLKSYNAINPSSEHIRVLRSNGILILNSVPRGSLISGFSSVIKLNGRTQKEMLIKERSALHINWNNKKVSKIYEFFRNAKAYLLEGKYGRDLNYDAVLDVLNKKLPVFVHVSNKDEIINAIEFSRAFDLRIVIVGTYGIRETIDYLKKYNIDVILDGIHKLPMEDDPYDDIFTLPKLLSENNINFCISTTGSAFAIFDERNLPYHVSSSIAFGLDRITALNSVTINCAKILGINDNYGSIEENKSATFFISNGDIFEFNSRIIKAFIDGIEIDLRNKHIELFEKYIDQ